MSVVAGKPGELEDSQQQQQQQQQQLLPPPSQTMTMTTTTSVNQDMIADKESGPTLAALFRTPGGGVLLAASFCFCTAFLWMQFMGSFVVLRITGSPRLVQLAGSLQMAPMVLGPLLGRVADRPGWRDRLELVAFCATVASSAAIAAAALLEIPCDLVGPAVMGGPSSGRTAWLAMIFAQLLIVGAAMPTYFVVRHHYGWQRVSLHAKTLHACRCDAGAETA